LSESDREFPRFAALIFSITKPESTAEIGF